MGKRFLKRMLNQKAVYWGTPAGDGYGGFTFADPVELDCRWEDKTELFVSPAGEETPSQAVVYLPQDVDVGGYLFLGALDDINSDQDPQGQDGAYRIKQVYKTPDIKGKDFLRKVWL
jgi:hypothetical protein